MAIDPTATVHEQAFVDDTITLGPRTVIRQFASVTGGTVMGADCSIAPFCMIHGPVFGDRVRLAGGIMIGPGFRVGHDVFIGPNVTFANDSWPRSTKERFRPEAFDGSRWAVIVEDGASIGANSVILPGVRIGARAMIAAGSVVTRDVLPDQIWTKTGDTRPILGSPERMRFAR
jgi:acetyltransferase-like isoleucine patch superfamily enzyme